MSVTAWRKPSSAKSVPSGLGGTTAWGTPGNIVSDNNSDSDLVLAPSGTNNGHDWLLGYDFGFSSSIVPANATIDGIEMRYEGWRSSGAGTNGVFFSNATKDASAGSPTFFTNINVLQALNGTRTVYTGASSSELFGTSWTPSDINSADFGVALTGGVQSGQTATLSIDYIEVRIYFTLPENNGGMFMIL